ncbi:uncharacterized protein G2W53_016966 [Senna tora]|uniref:Uncharacterized protein n=1 Tax=Senna tora TaxID=362788 RepID=A0A834WK12_9FABA|nr:uncharacterized protein G2W53_016966 [Senna tora]
MGKPHFMSTATADNSKGINHLNIG